MKIYQISAALFILICFYANCRIAQAATDPAVRLYKRGSCISIDVPPITLTPSQTAAERQLIGNETQIEEDGWLIASAKSTKGSSEFTEDTQRAKQLYRELGILEFYRENLEKYKNEGIIGESYTGYLLKVPPVFSEKYIDPYDLKNINNLIIQVNQSRKWIYEYYLELELKKISPDKTNIQNKYLHSHYNQSHPGEWIYSEQMQWRRKN